MAWQNTGYNQPPHPSFYIGSRPASASNPRGMSDPESSCRYSAGISPRETHVL
ncbi:hypothetical protein [Glycomyces sp. NPDC021274]|uniref:rhamnogalacturonan lyase family protein n=1 Tax=Glycomyces sp. NPDC021274 TaxID=3155120 RepID=UPI00341026E3